jgi:hypothetical protein
MNCGHCHFQDGRSHLGRLNEPNMPTLKEAEGHIISVNGDGHDSNNNPRFVMNAVASFKNRFYNTSMPGALHKFDAPVVLTVNPGRCTDEKFTPLDQIPTNLMFARVRVNTWNLELVDSAIEYYSSKGIPIVLTFMTYYSRDIPVSHKKNYVQSHVKNITCFTIRQQAWEEVMARYLDNELVYSCGTNANGQFCKNCGNCQREYQVTMARLAINSAAG